jgi:hypothetical protein
MLTLLTEKDTRLNFPMKLRNGAQQFLNIISFLIVAALAAVVGPRYYETGQFPPVPDVIVAMVVPVLLFVFFSVVLLFGVKRAGMEISESGRIATTPLAFFGIRFMAEEEFRLTPQSLLIVKKVALKGKNRSRTYYVVDLRPHAESGPDLRLAKSADEVLAHKFAKEFSAKFGMPIRGVEQIPSGQSL